jgi:non-homologous end joining protein Ku
MKVKLKPGIGIIANAGRDLVPGVEYEVGPVSYNPEIMDIIEAKSEPHKINLDINKDGKVDKKDASLAGKVLKSISSKKKAKKK